MYFWWWLSDWRGLRAWISGLGAGAAAIAGGYLIWVQLYPADKHGGLHLAAIIVVTAVALGSALARPLRIHTLDRADRQRDKVADALRMLPWAAHDLTDGEVPVRPLGASAWLIVLTLRGQRLHRIARERINQTPGPSKIRWTKGKGVIGSCWKTGKDACYHAEAFDTLHGGDTRTDWDELDHDTRMGLAFDEYVQVRGKYGTVIAVPLTDRRRDKIIGVVALDAPRGWHEWLKQPKVTQAVADAAGTVANLVT